MPQIRSYVSRAYRFQRSGLTSSEMLGGNLVLRTPKSDLIPNINTYVVVFQKEGDPNIDPKIL